jgi:hypothetical protein
MLFEIQARQPTTKLSGQREYAVLGRHEVVVRGASAQGSELAGVAGSPCWSFSVSNYAMTPPRKPIDYKRSVLRLRTNSNRLNILFEIGCPLVSVYERPVDSYWTGGMSDGIFKVFMGLTTAPAMAFALDYLVHGITFKATPNPACLLGCSST